MINFPFGRREPDEVRRRTTETIWKYATGMLAISIPIAGATHSVLMPLFVVIGAALATAAVWGLTPREAKAEPDLKALEERVRRIDERLSNVEIISSFDRLLAEKSAASERQNPK